MREAKCLNCYLIEIHVSTIRFSVYYQQYTNSIFSFVQRGIGNIKTQYTLVRHTRTRLLNTFHPYFKFQGSLCLCSDQLSPPLSRTDQSWYQLTWWITIDWHQERHAKWKCSITNKYASISCRHAGVASKGRRRNGNISYIYIYIYLIFLLPVWPYQTLKLKHI